VVVMRIFQACRVAVSRGVGPAALIVALGASSALADGPYSLDKEIREVRGWTIAANQARRGCLAFAAYQSQTALEVGFDTRKDTSFMLFANEGWDFIVPGKSYDVKLVFDGSKNWSGTAEGVKAGSLHGLALEGIKSAFVVDFARYSSVQFHLGKRRLDGFSLSGTRAAVEAAIDCSKDVQSGSISFDEPAPTPAKPAPTPPTADKPREPEKADKEAKGPSTSTGTGFFVNDAGHLVTNAHVVEDCSEATVKLPDGRGGKAAILARSTQNDLAVLKADLAPSGFAKLRGGQQARLGDSIVVFGYPLAGELTITGNLSTGLISAMAGPGEDVTRMQISAPVQSGNSGGAVADQSGHVVGVVVAKANTRARGDGGSEVLQNVNFAIKSGVVGYFLDANQIAYTQEPADGDKSTADVAAVAKTFSALVICRSK
jgi:S1-C subfamily serine protease